MAGKGLVFRSILLLFFIITIISAASLQSSTQRTNNTSITANRACVTIPSECYASGAPGNVLVGICNGGECHPCVHNPLRCCAVTAGNCTSPNGSSWGVCAPACNCYGC